MSWITGPEKCLECGYACIAVFPAVLWGTGRECPECGREAMFCSEDLEDDGVSLEAGE